MMGKPSLLIVTLNDYIVYQPTILNLYDVLTEEYEVTIISFEPQFISKQRDEIRNIIYLKPNVFLKEVLNKTDLILGKLTKFLKKILPGINYHYLYYNFQLPKVLERELVKHKPDVVIAVDVPALVVSQGIFGKVHFLSLEIDNKDPFFKKIKKDLISSVFIQSSSRFQYLFQQADIPCFLVQNSPVSRFPRKAAEARSGLVWAGTILDRFGVYDCVEFIKKYEGYKLVLKGGAEKNTLQYIQTYYQDLMANGRLEIDRAYLPEKEFIGYLSSFRIGFCFYSWALIESSVNYQTAPSGKLFMYMAAGVPVVACRIPGFQFVEDFGAGILIDNYQPETIKKAIERIEADYKSFSDACYEVTDHFDFRKNVIPYVEYLRKNHTC